eukprot:Nk52_evm26s270 gene=Nk52_evmTU26s270
METTDNKPAAASQVDSGPSASLNQNDSGMAVEQASTDTESQKQNLETKALLRKDENLEFLYKGSFDNLFSRGEVNKPGENLVNLKCRLVTWDHCNFTLTVPNSYTVFGVIRLILERFDEIPSNVKLYKDKREEENLLENEDFTLAQYGFAASNSPSPESPQQIPNYTLYFDIAPKNLKCPLLISDYYFDPNQDILNKYL